MKRKGGMESRDVFGTNEGDFNELDGKYRRGMFKIMDVMDF